MLDPDTARTLCQDWIIRESLVNEGRDRVGGFNKRKYIRRKNGEERPRKKERLDSLKQVRLQQVQVR